MDDRMELDTPYAALSRRVCKGNNRVYTEVWKGSLIG